jgi:hypothetical protein
MASTYKPTQGYTQKTNIDISLQTRKKLSPSSTLGSRTELKLRWVAQSNQKHTGCWPDAGNNKNKFIVEVSKVRFSYPFLSLSHADGLSEDRTAVALCGPVLWRYSVSFGGTADCTLHGVYFALIFPSKLFYCC